MNPLGTIHLLAAIASIALGGVVLLLPKGSRRHRRLGWAYAVAMLATNVTALMIYRLFGGFGPFHVAALMSLATILLGVPAGMRARRARIAQASSERGRAVEWHYYWMSYSYLGLLAAAVSEAATRLPIIRVQGGPGLGFGLAVAIATAIVFAIGVTMIKRSAQPLLSRFRK